MSLRRTRPPILVSLAILAGFAGSAAAGTSLRFHGNGTADVDRVKIRVDDPTNANPGPPADVGAADFTIELWMRGRAAENPAPAVACGANVSWISGHVLVDRDRYNQDRKFGVSVAGGRLAFGVSGAGTGDRTICGTSDVLDDRWHHVAVQRRRADGRLWLFVDGVKEAEADGPDGDVSYPDDGVPGPFCGGSPCTGSDPFLVIGAEKHDAGPGYPSFGGWVDELRISTTLRYASTFTRPAGPFAPDASTAALYHFDEGGGDVVADSSGAAGGPSPGERRFGGSPAGPEWSPEVPPFSRTFGLRAVASGLDRVVALAHAGDGSSRLFVVEQPGRIRILDGAQARPAPFLDISTLVSCCGERGLLSAAFHPQYATNGAFYVYYTNTNGDLVLARYRVSADANVADPASGAILLTIPHPGYANHNGGHVAFGADGRLYLSTGDGGGGGDPDGNAQDLGSLLGKVLRLAVDGGAGYSVPPDNPFVSTPGARPEIWAYGLRNPWRIAFDRRTDDLFIADVGQGSREEIDFEPAGAGGRNYGWVRMEGSLCYRPSTGCNDGTLTLPVLEYSHALGCSVTGGYRYRGRSAAGLDGAYLFGDYCSGRVWGGIQDGAGAWSSVELVDTAYNITTFGEDESGELYLVAYGASSTIYRITGGSSPPFGSFDTPANGASGLAGNVPVTGWALDDTSVHSVEIWRSPVAGETQGSVFVGQATFVPGARPDVAAAHPALPNADRAGWGYMLLTNMLPAGGNGSYALQAWAVDGDGSRTLLGSKTITCANATATKPFGTIDTPAQGQTVSGSAYAVFGWALTPPPGTVPIDGSTIWVYVDGVPVGHPAYNLYRSDVAALFPGYANTDGAVGLFVLDTTTLANGIHSIAWSVTDELGRTDGIGSRYFWVQN
ncbi:MAG: PQQ-dependent sugar dehydrogenase [Chloroflexi bacterium]|nr:PQQ-dependent sugar dehydrogenase [Chloroflexota bacterium]